MQNLAGPEIAVAGAAVLRITGPGSRSCSRRHLAKQGLVASSGMRLVSVQ
jgi:hypothetical protein